MSERRLREAPIEPLSHQAWRRVEAAVFTLLDEGIAMPLPVGPYHSYAAPRERRRPRWPWTLGMGLSVAAAAVASVVHGVHSRRPAELAHDAAVLRSGPAAANAAGEVALGAPAAPVAPAPTLAAAPNLERLPPEGKNGVGEAALRSRPSRSPTP
jgi:hypothetical protein